jgi:hypothetical protein
VEPSAEFELFKEDLGKQLLDPDGGKTIEETLRSIDYLEARLLAGCKAIEMVENPSGQIVALHHLARYAGWLLLMFQETLGHPIEFYGWISRSLFEVYVLALFVLRSEENARLFLDAALTDEIVMLEGILRLPGAPEAAIKLQERVERLKARRGDSISRLPDYATLAGIVGVKEEYQAFWKLFSKYVHPSSWVVTGEPDKVRSPGYQQIFQMQAQFNAHRILVLLHAELGKVFPGEDAQATRESNPAASGRASRTLPALPHQPDAPLIRISRRRTAGVSGVSAIPVPTSRESQNPPAGSAFQA